MEKRKLIKRMKKAKWGVLELDSPFGYTIVLKNQRTKDKEQELQELLEVEGGMAAASKTEQEKQKKPVKDMAEETKVIKKEMAGKFVINQVLLQDDENTSENSDSTEMRKKEAASGPVRHRRHYKT